VVLILAALAAAQEPDVGDVIPHAQDRPPNPPKTPAEAIAAMTVPEGFRVELVAAEPDLVNPVAMTFDEKGRIWVAESLEYPRREPGPGRDRLKVFEDTDGDGQADRVTIFCEGLNIPSGVAVGHGGVWVANSPDILFFPDADRDAVPDGPPDVVATGFGRADTHELPNSLTWGPDGWLYGWNGVFNPSRVSSNNGKTYEFTCAIWRIHPRTREFQIWCEGTSNPWGIAINDEGEFFASACVIDHLWHLVEGGYYIRQGGPYPPFTAPHGSIVNHTHQKAAYCGVVWFDSEAYPEEYRGRLYMGNIHGNCINVDELQRDGASYKATARPDFLSANDAWFMPVSQKVGPDGCLYILDWYDRYHCYQDANRDPEGIDRLKGRLYRVRYRETPRRFGFDLGRETDEALIARLGAANIYDRETAQRLLTERLAGGTAQPGTREALEALVGGGDAAMRRPVRMHALWALIGSGAIDEAGIGRLLDDPDPVVRAWAVRAAGDGGADPALVLGRLSDPNPVVRTWAVVAAAKVCKETGLAARVLEASASEADPLLAHVVWQVVHPRLDDPAEVDLLADVAESRMAVSGSMGARLWPRLVARVAAAPRVDGVKVARLARIGLERFGDEAAVARETLDRLTAAVREGVIASQRLHGLRAELGSVVRDRAADRASAVRADALKLAAAWGDPEALDALRAVFADDQAEPWLRIEALRVLVAQRDLGVIDRACELATDRGVMPAEARRRLIEALGELDEPRVAERLLAAYGDLGPGVRPTVVAVLSGRASWGRALLAAVARGVVPKSEIHLNQVRRLLATRDPEIAAAVRQLWGVIREGRDERRDLVVGQMRNFLAKTPGDPVAGRAVYQKICATCHKIYGEGQDVGPEITLNGRNDWDQLISNVFDPNLVIGEAYQAVNVATTDGRVLTGLLVEDSPARVVLRLQGGENVAIPRAEVEDQQVASVSLMPEGIETQLTPQEIADLFAFLALDKPPEDPTAKRLPGAPEVPRREAGRGQ
jgi:putative heme-binding domain-containing protein